MEESIKKGDTLISVKCLNNDNKELAKKVLTATNAKKIFDDFNNISRDLHVEAQVDTSLNRNMP